MFTLIFFFYIQYMYIPTKQYCILELVKFWLQFTYWSWKFNAHFIKKKNCTIQWCYLRKFSRQLHHQSTKKNTLFNFGWDICKIISREIRPLAALYPPPPPTKKVLYMTAISSFSLDIRCQWSPGAFASVSIVSV